MSDVDHLRLSLDCWSCIPCTRKVRGGAPRCRYRGVKTGANCVRNNGSSQLLSGRDLRGVDLRNLLRTRLDYFKLQLRVSNNQVHRLL
jgi:hypothetical protein